MNLYEMSKNIRNINREITIRNAIGNVKKDLNGLVEARTCKIYNRYLCHALLNSHVPAKLMDTLDLEYDFEHQFVLVPHEQEEGIYYLIDLIFSSFCDEATHFSLLKTMGYQIVNQIDYQAYLNIIDLSFQIAKNKERGI